MGLSFRNPEAEAAARELGLSIADLEACLGRPTHAEAVEALDALRARVKKNYREAALRLHPDHNAGDPAKAALFRTVSALWTELQKIQIRRPPPPPRPTVVVIRFGGGAGWSDTSTSTTTSYPW